MNQPTVIDRTDSWSFDKLGDQWRGSVVGSECSLHQLAPYIGKMKSAMAGSLISTFTHGGDTLYDPFSGSGTVALEAWAANRNIIANDLSPYAHILTEAKLFPCLSVEEALAKIELSAPKVHSLVPNVDISSVPTWVQSFFNPDTLREVISWVNVLMEQKSYFILACLLGILHHQRPGFLSYPSSHTVPYLRVKKFPRNEYPGLYEYRPVRGRLEKKVTRALRRVPPLREEIIRESHMCDASKFAPQQKIDCIITSPAYMRRLDYARDNRLRLWFLGVDDWKALDRTISCSEEEFLHLLKSCLKLWRSVLVPGGLCVLVLGDSFSRLYNLPLPDLVAAMATKEVGGYSVRWRYTEAIPSNRRVRRSCSGNVSETILVLSNDRGK